MPEFFSVLVQPDIEGNILTKFKKKTKKQNKLVLEELR